MHMPTSRQILIAGLMLLPGLMLDACTEQSAEPAESVAAETSAPAAPKGPYATSAQRSDWPPLNQESAVAVADLNTVNYYVVLDGSGSMRRTECSGAGNKMEAAIAALSAFVGTVPSDANLGLTVFDDAGLSERVPLASGNREAFQQQLTQVNARRGTPLRSSIQLGYEKLTAQAQRQLGYGEYHLVVVTDGHADPESEEPAGVVNEILYSSPVILHTIGFCIGSEHSLNQPGRVYYMAADDPAQLKQGLASVLAEAPSFDVTKFQ